MCQQGVNRILEKNPDKWIKCSEMNEILNISTASANCSRLFRWNEVERRRVRGGNYYEYEYRIKS